MAKDEIIIKLRVDDGQLKISSANIDKHSKKLDKNTKTKDKGTKASNRFNKAEKGLYQTNLSGSKAFSKMNQTMGGSSGLVAAYATLAANVFAATAAFGALQRAAQFSQLQKGLTELGQQSGRTLSIMAEGLREVTGGAISAEEAMRAAALGVSGGFGGEQLAGLAKIAKGASITLGRSLPDAFDRLTRGAIKLEPEILDELGIMVRLDDAVENYGAQIGKAGSALTQMERRQAFMNAILEQGESKFGEIADAVDPDPYSRLGATFGDLTNAIFDFFNTKIFFGFFGLNEVVSVLADNMGMLFGVMVLFGSTIAGKMIPALAGGAEAAANQADKLAHLAIAAGEAQAEQAAFLSSGLGQIKKMPKHYTDLVVKLKETGDQTKNLADLRKSLNAQMRTQQKLIDTTSGKELAAAKLRMGRLEAESAALTRRAAIEAGVGAAALTRRNAEAASDAQALVTKALMARANKDITFAGAWKDITKSVKSYKKALIAAAQASLGTDVAVKGLTLSKIKLKAAIFGVRSQLKLMMGEFLILLLPLALIIIAVTAFWAIWSWKNNTEAQKKYNKGTKDLAKLTEELPAKVIKYNKALENSKNLADGQLRAFEISSGIITEMNDKLRATIKLRKEADAGTGRDERLGLRQVGAEAAMVGGKKAKNLAADMGFDSDYFKTLKDGEDSLTRALMIRGSDEMKVSNALLKDGIPDQVTLLKAKLEAIWGDEALGFDAAKIAKAVQGALGEVENAFGNLGPAAKGIRDALKEAEKEGSKFLNTFAKKTSVDMFAKSTATAVKAITEMKTSVEELQAAAKDEGITLDINVDETIGKSLLDIGAKMAAMIGPDFVRAQKELTKTTRELDAAIKEGKSEDIIKGLKEKTVDAAKALGGYRTNVIALNDDILKTQRLELTRKQTLIGINKVIKFASKNYKINAKLAGIDAQMTLKKLKYEQEITKAKIAQVKKMFETISYMEKSQVIGEEDQEVRISMEDFLLKTLEEQQAIIEKTNLTQQNLFSLLGSVTEEKMQQLDIEKEAASLSANTALQRAEALREQLKMQKKISDLEDVGFKLSAKKDAFLKRGSTTLLASEEADLKIQAAKKAWEMASSMAAVEKSIIDAKAQLQITEAEFLNKKIDVLNAEARLMGLVGADVEKIPIEEQKKAILEAADLQKKAIDQNIKNLESQVTVAFLQGLEAFRKDIKDGKITLGVALTGQSDIMEQLKSGRVGALNQDELKLMREGNATFRLLYRHLLKTLQTGSGLIVHDPAIQEEIDILEGQKETMERFGKEQEVKRGRAIYDPAIMEEYKRKLAINEDLNKQITQIIANANAATTAKMYPRLSTLFGGTSGSDTTTEEQTDLAKKNVAASEAFVVNVETGAIEYTIEEIAVTAIKRVIDSTVAAIESTAANLAGTPGQGPPAPEKKGLEIITREDMAAEGKSTVAEALQGARGGATEEDFVDSAIDKGERYLEMVTQMRTTTEEFARVASQFGPEGEAYAAMMGGIFNEDTGLIAAMDGLINNTEGGMAALGKMQAVIGAIGNVMAQSSKMAIAQIDNQIAAEKARDGSSEKSVAKIKAMEAKKLAVQKKAFEMKKKIGIAETMIATFTSAMQAFKTFSEFPPLAAAMAAMVIAFGMKQVSMISKQQFTGGTGADTSAAKIQEITVGKRSSKVDVAQKASAGELAYLRGERGIGTTSTNFVAQGGAAGMRKGYATGGSILVGEQGPETITPLSPMQVWPSGQGAKSQINANFTIHAIDAAGVEEVLLGQQGNIINMIQSAAHDYGEEFLEAVNVDTYGETDSGYGGG